MEMERKIHQPHKGIEQLFEGIEDTAEAWWQVWME